MLTPEQRAEFDEQGFVRLRGVFSDAEAAAMEAHVWAALERKHGVCPDDPETWNVPPGTGLQPLRTHRVFEPNGGPALLGALDDLLGEGHWQKPKHWGQFLVSFPVKEQAAPMRTVWHTDFPYFMPPDRVAGALVFSFFSQVPTRTGGTLVMAGSPRLITHFLEAKPQLRKVKMKVARRALMQSDPWLQGLNAESDEGDWTTRLVGSGHEIADARLRVVELSGEPGDVVVGHPWLLHTPWPNHGDRPRFMRVQRIVGGA